VARLANDCGESKVNQGEDPKSHWQQVIGELEIARERGQSKYALERL